MPDLHVRPTRLDALGILRERTSLAHRRLEDRLDLLHIGTAQVRSVARRLDAFWAAGEPAVDAWARQQTAMATALDWPRRRRFAPRSADPVDTATALGWLYVREGSTLGGAVIARHHPGLRLDTFTPYPEGPGPMWRRYVEVLQAWATAGPADAAGDPDAATDAATDADPDARTVVDVEAAADAAVATFAALERAL